MASTKKTASTGAKATTSAKEEPKKTAPKKAAAKPAAPKIKDTPQPTSAAKPAARKSASKSAAPKKAEAKKVEPKTPAKTAEKKPAAKLTPAKSAPTAKAPAGEKNAASSANTIAKADSSTKPDAKKAAPAKPAPRREGKESLTAEERERVKKLRATLDLLKADPEWPAFLEEQKAALFSLRDHLLPNMQNTTRDHLRSGASNVSSSSGQHIGDAGSEAEVRDLTINLLNKDREQLFEIDAALERIRRGTYGICEISLDPIPKGRLRVRPFCRLTVKCQEEYEKKYGSYANYRAKNSDHVGYSGLQNDMKNAISLDDGEE